MVTRTRTVTATVLTTAVLTGSVLTGSVLAAQPAAAATTTAVAGQATGGAREGHARSNEVGGQYEIAVARGWFPYPSLCAAAGVAGVVAGKWESWWCTPLLVGWRLHTNR